MSNSSKGPKGSSANPAPFDVRAAREAAGLTQTEAAGLVHTSCRTWQQWEAEADSTSHRRMHPAFWELFRLKIATRISHSRLLVTSTLKYE